MSEISKLEQNLIIKKIDDDTKNIQIIDNDIKYTHFLIILAMAI